MSSTKKQVHFMLTYNSEKEKPSKGLNIKQATIPENHSIACQESAIKAYNVGKFTEKYLKTNFDTFQELYILFVLEQFYMRNKLASKIENNITNEYITFKRWIKIKNPEHETPKVKQFLSLLSNKATILKQVS